MITKPFLTNSSTKSKLIRVHIFKPTNHQQKSKLLKWRTRKKKQQKINMSSRKKKKKLALACDVRPGSRRFPIPTHSCIRQEAGTLGVFAETGLPGPITSSSWLHQKPDCKTATVWSGVGCYGWKSMERIFPTRAQRCHVLQPTLMQAGSYQYHLGWQTRICVDVVQSPTREFSRQLVLSYWNNVSWCRSTYR